jgi:hypothetical protein
MLFDKKIQRLLFQHVVFSDSCSLRTRLQQLLLGFLHNLNLEKQWTAPRFM